MNYSIEIEIIGRITVGAILDATRTITLAYAVEVQNELSNDKPRPPSAGSMKFKTDKQRKFVMANIRQGKITVPYVRGRGSKLHGSQTLNRSYRVDLQQDTAVLTSSASYAPYVVGDQQADIHKGRWTTAIDAADKIHKSGSLQSIVEDTFKGLDL
jgi:hypothetical protein